MNVRVGNAGDLAAAVPMMRKYRSLHERWDPSLYKLHKDSEKRIQRWLGPIIEDPRTLLLVAEEDRKIIGFLSVKVEADMPLFECDEHAMVMEFWVEPEFGCGCVSGEIEQFRRDTRIDVNVGAVDASR